MKQIDSDQIITNSIPDNTVRPIPRDLGSLLAMGHSNSDLSLLNRSEFDNESNSAPSAPTTYLPDTPSLIGVKQQTVKIKEDGTYAVDLIIEVEDVRNVSDYEVRISKGAGNI